MLNQFNPTYKYFLAFTESTYFSPHNSQTPTFTSMAFPISATAVSLAGLPFAAIQTAVVLESAIKAVSPNARLQKWSHRLAEVSGMVDTNTPYIPADAMDKFLYLVHR